MSLDSVHSLRSFLLIVIALTVFVLGNLVWSLGYLYTPLGMGFVYQTSVLKTESETRTIFNRVFYRNKTVSSSPGMLPTVQTNSGLSGKPFNETTTTVKSTSRPSTTVKSTTVISRQDVCENCFEHNFKYIIQNDAVCNPREENSTIDLIVLVFTVHGHFKKREAIRETWLAVSGGNKGTIRHVFLLGHTNDENLSKKVEEENDVHHDIIKESFVDSYQNLTYKTIMGFKWVTNFCSKARFVMKTDDDMYVNLPHLVPVLVKEETTLQSSVSGTCAIVAEPIRDARSKWFASVRSYPHKHYPGFCSGTGYVTSSFVAGKIYEISKMVPFFHLEDVYVALCVKKLGFKLRRLPGFHNTRVMLDPCIMKTNRILTSHEIPMEFLYKIRDAKCT
ncbi:beta-1,3-galactosyltransferase 1-like [Gigantopelta aegis]|uniref:beta-1,3-galactosyltransferase 1-like n=1 Tax=Gigantopelta aegis TaxID=1735272 RepID=UPI001B88CB03|nr:beta-1,3-galactosyltransferase 1-like [Gigantopelta aegis]